MTNVIHANADLLDDILLYPMQGFYLLQIPLMKPIKHFYKALLGKQDIVLLGDENTLVINTNESVTSILSEYRLLKTETIKPILGILTKGSIEQHCIKHIEFVEYGQLSEIKKSFDNEQLKLIKSLLTEVNKHECL